MSPADYLHPAQRLLSEAVANGKFPGAQALVAQGGNIVWKEAHGLAQLMPEEVETDLDVFYDLASLTKPMVTATGIALLVAQGRLRLDDPLEAHLPIAAGNPIGEVGIRHLLAHQSGLPAWKPYYDFYRDRLPSTPAEYARAHKEVCLQIVAERKEYETASRQVYSDLDFILLGEAVSAAFGRTLVDVYNEQIAGPFHLAAHFNPLPLDDSKHRYASTERSEFRGHLLNGEVDDDNAAVMGGVAGHAGLFGTVDDVFQIAQGWLEGYHGRSTILPKEVVREFWTPARSEPERTWALGWDTPSKENSTAGKHFSAAAVGHLGFTGTSVWIEPEKEIVVCLLTNRVHPSRENESLKSFRPAFHDAVMEGISRNAFAR